MNVEWRDPRTMTDDEIRDEVNIITENLAECGRHSAYAERCLPRQRALRVELMGRAR